MPRMDRVFRPAAQPFLPPWSRVPPARLRRAAEKRVVRGRASSNASAFTHAHKFARRNRKRTELRRQSRGDFYSRRHLPPALFRCPCDAFSRRCAGKESTEGEVTSSV